MSVYTTVRRDQLERFLGAYTLGELSAFSGIEAGIENTNYFVSTTRGEYVLTLFESTPSSRLAFCLDLMAYLADRGVVSAHPQANRHGRYLGRLNHRPAAVVARLPGVSVLEPRAEHCAALGAAMAHMHLAVRGFGQQRADERGRAWRLDVARRIAAHLGAADRALLDTVLADAPLVRAGELPGGVIHADLFRDNVLFDGVRVSGIIDFYYACDGPFIYDIAIAVADWCFTAQGLDVTRACALLEAYQATRAVGGGERAAWHAAIRAAGARFWLSRLNDELFPRPGVLTHTKDPEPFRRVLLAGLEGAPELDAVWRDGASRG